MPFYSTFSMSDISKAFRINPILEGDNIHTSIIGWGHTRFCRHDDKDLEALIVEVTRQAIAHAEVDSKDIDAIFLGNFNGGFVPDSFTSSLVLQADPDLRFTPATRLENACASGAAAVFAGIDAIESGRAKTVLVVGAEKMTAVSGKVVGDILGSASYVKEEASTGLNFPGIFARIAQDYFRRYGEHADTLARIAAKNHANGAKKPLAHLQKDLGFAFCRQTGEDNPMVAAPLRRTDCSTVADGAAALILSSDEIARSAPQQVRFRATAQVNDFLPMSRRDILAMEGPKRAWQQALGQAGMAISDLSFAEVHDCFTIAELLIYEAMGLAPAGQGAQVIDSGMSFIGGALPVNPSGGLKAKGHPVGATGVSMHVLSAKQLVGEMGDLQVAGAQVGGIFNMGGSIVANYVSLLEAV